VRSGSIAVIASEAKQSISARNESMDCFVASLLAMTVHESTTTPPPNKNGEEKSPPL
jgi:hypothetical protein